jgi:hypothetical protein
MTVICAVYITDYCTVPGLYLRQTRVEHTSHTALVSCVRFNLQTSMSGFSTDSSRFTGTAQPQAHDTVLYGLCGNSVFLVREACVSLRHCVHTSWAVVLSRVY